VTRTVSFPRSRSTTTCAKLKIASLLPYVDDLAPGIDCDAESPLEPAGDRLAELRQALRLRVAAGFAESVDERLPDQRIGRLPRVALPEVEDLDPGCGRLPFRLLDADERVRGLGSQDG